MCQLSHAVSLAGGTISGTFPGFVSGFSGVSSPAAEVSGSYPSAAY